jgi:TRAP-type C4-dicarboxylate transport system substrate-binding protein
VSRKKILTFVLALVMVVTVIAVPLLIGCQGDEEPTDGTTTPGTTPTTPGTGTGTGTGTTTDGKPEELPEIRCVFASQGSASSMSAKEEFRLFQKWNEAAPNYDIVWEPHWTDEIFPGPQQVEALANGAIQMGSMYGYREEGFEPVSSIFTVPLLWTSHDHFVRFMATPEMQAVFQEDIDKGVYPQWSTSYTMWLAFSDTFVDSPDDVEGMRIRAMESPIMTRAIELLGASPIAVTVSELTVAMQTGMFEGMIATVSPGYIVYLGYLDYMDYVIEVPITYSMGTTAFNSEWFLGLPDEVRLAYYAVVDDWFANLMNCQVQEQERGKNMWRDDCEEYQPTDAELDEWAALMGPLFDEVDQRLGRGLMDAALSTRFGDPQGQFGGLWVVDLDERYGDDGYFKIEVAR